MEDPKKQPETRNLIFALSFDMFCCFFSDAFGFALTEKVRSSLLFQGAEMAKLLSYRMFFGGRGVGKLQTPQC